MTKRILALLLALLLPAAALAENFCLEYSVELDAENASALFRTMGLFSGADNEETLCKAMVELLDGFSFRLLTQDDATRVEVNFDETTLLDFTVITGAENLVFTSDLMDGAGLSIPMAAMDLENDALVQMMGDTDWEKLLSGMATAALGKLEAVEMTRTRGSFAGSAYTGGVWCTTIVVDDQWIADMIDALLTDEMRALVIDVADYFGFDGKNLFSAIDEANAAASQANAHRYIIRLISDEQENPVGISVTVMRGDEQLAALSLGIEKNQLTLVIGIGMDDANYWHYQKFSWEELATGDNTAAARLGGQILEFTAPKTDDFAFALETYSDLRMQRDWQVILNRLGDHATWQWKYNVTERMPGSAAVHAQDGQGQYSPAGHSFSNTCTYSWDGAVYMTETFSLTPCDAIPTDVSGLTLCDLTGDDEELMQEIAFNFAGALASRLLAIFPMELLLYFQ